MPSPLRHLLVTLLLGLLTAACWWGWMAWDTTYDVDPATGDATGPFEAWQVLGCVLSLVVVGLIASTLLHPMVVMVVMPVVFTAVFSVTAAADDESGLWAVGALMVLVGMVVGTSVVTLVGNLAKNMLGRRQAA